MIYYTYSHSTPSGKVFYIGKGHDNRAYNYRDRGWSWREAVANAKGILIKIEAEWVTEKEAFEHEIYLIKHHKELRAKLVNLTEGGSGPLGYMQSKATREKISKKVKGYIHTIITCPHCNTSGGKTSMKRWHFDKCTGKRQFKSRVSIFGKRIYLGYYETKDLAVSVAKEFHDFVLNEFAELKRQNRAVI